MSTPVGPSTPATPASKQNTPSTPITGTWRHPRFDEITKRQNASNFSDRNAKRVLYNAGALIGLWVLAGWLWSTFPGFFNAGEFLDPYAKYLYYAFQLMFVYNIIVACWPLLRRKDDLSDIPLTPAQRKLLGLPPSSRPSTPETRYITPPRYARTPTPLSGSPASKGSYSNSPISGRCLQGSRGGSPFSPTSSPLLQKAMDANPLNGGRRHSYGSPSLLGPRGVRPNVAEPSGSPSPAAGKIASVGLTSRWLFEKGRRNSGNLRLYA